MRTEYANPQEENIQTFIRPRFKSKVEMKLPNSDRAVVEIEKLSDYCLNPEHPRGKHKAKVFAVKFGITAADAETLRNALLAAALNQEAVLGVHDGHGQRYTLDFRFTGSKGGGDIRSSWIVRRGEDFPRLTSCYAL